MENYEFGRRYKMSELFPKESAESFATAICYLSIANFFLACITIVMITTQTPATMKSFRNLLLALLFSSMTFDIFTIFYKPAVLLPLPIFIPVNPIPGVTDALDSFGSYIVVVNMFITIDFLLCMVIQRYFTMSNLVVSHPKYLEKSVYGIVFFTNGIMILMLIFSNVTGDRLDKPHAILFVQKHIIDWENLLAMVEYPSTSTVFLRTDFISRFEQCYTAFFVISRIFGFILFTYKNMRVIIGTNETPQNRKQHQMIIKLLKFEFYAVFLLVIIPSNLLIYSIAMQIPAPLIPMYCTLLIKLYPPVDTFLTALLIKPYRNFIKKVFCKVFRLKSAKVSDSSSTPYNNNVGRLSVAASTNRS